MFFIVKPRSDGLLRKSAKRITEDPDPSRYAHKALANFFDTLEGHVFDTYEKAGSYVVDHWPEFANGQISYDQFSVYRNGFWLALEVEGRTTIQTVHKVIDGDYHFWCGNICRQHL